MLKQPKLLMQFLKSLLIIKPTKVEKAGARKPKVSGGPIKWCFGGYGGFREGNSTREEKSSSTGRAIMEAIRISACKSGMWKFIVLNREVLI